MWSNVVGRSRIVGECAQRKATRFVLLTRCSQKDVIKKYLKVGTCGMWHMAYGTFGMGMNI
jgi:hypothetical protein